MGRAESNEYFKPALMRSLRSTSSMQAFVTVPTCEVTELGDPVLSCATVQGLNLLCSYHIPGEDSQAPLGF